MKTVSISSSVSEDIDGHITLSANITSVVGAGLRGKKEVDRLFNGSETSYVLSDYGEYNEKNIAIKSNLKESFKKSSFELVFNF